MQIVCEEKFKLLYIISLAGLGIKHHFANQDNVICRPNAATV
jgi:hypothetical protein